jgi:predicted Rossmann fold nucleotide-binding protein DprA/Smf involved in DNA uptake
MITAIVGSRTFDNYDQMIRVLDAFTITRVVSGGAGGADTLAARWAAECNIPLSTHLPQWDRYGKRAGAVRNRAIVNEAEQVIAFWDGQSKGTKITIDMAREAGKPVTVISELLAQ